MQIEPVLPSYASAASQIRLQFALQMASNCPTSLGRAIALTGSSAHGLADAASDAEINHWVDHLPSLDARAAYLTEAGVTALEAEPSPRGDGSEWFQGSWKEIPVEVGWQTFDAMDINLRPLFSGDTDTDRLHLGEVVANAVILRADDRLLSLQQALIRFPDALRDHLIAELSAPLKDETYWAAEERLARRGERLTVTRSLAVTLKTAIRLCFAVNRHWEASDKWLLTLAAHLPEMPVDWRARLDAALSAPPLQAVELAHAWCNDALLLAR